MFKVKNGIAPEIMNDVFQITEPNYNFRKKTEFKTGNVRTTHYGTESISCLGPKLWKILRVQYKNMTSLKDLYVKLRHWCLKTVLVVYVRYMYKILGFI